VNGGDEFVIEDKLLLSISDVKVRESRMPPGTIAQSQPEIVGF
jgi:hypothetical protein